MRPPERTRRRRVALVLSALVAPLLFALPSAAQSPDTVLGLERARSLLRRSNPDYGAALAAADAVGENVWSAWGALLPTVSAQAVFGRNEFTTRTFVDPTGVSQRLEEPITDVSKSTWQGLVFDWSVFEGGRQFFDLGASKAAARAADLGAAARLAQLESQLEVQYWEALKQQELARLARALLAARRRDVQVARARFRIAAVAQTDVLQAEVQAGQQELAVLRADQAAEAARRELSALVGLEEERAYAIRDSAAIFDPAELRPADLVSLARRSNPELARLDAEIEARGRSLWAARGSWLPNLRLSLQLSRSEILGPDEGLFEFSPENTGSDFRVTVSWPIFAGFEKKWRTGQESARLQEARHNKLAGTLATDRDVRNAYDALVTAYRAVQLQTRNVELARESVRLATERYRIGAATYVELQQATAQLSEAERGLIEARYDFMQSRARLEGAVGRPIARPR